MGLYKNAMEELVESKYEGVIANFDCCKCEICKNDIISCALNKLPPKYYATTQGQLFTKLETLRRQHSADVVTALVEGIKLVSQNPRHQE